MIVIRLIICAVGIITLTYLFFRTKKNNSIRTLPKIITNIRFSVSDIKYLQSSGLFSKDYLNYLKKFRQDRGTK